MTTSKKRPALELQAVAVDASDEASSDDDNDDVVDEKKDINDNVNDANTTMTKKKMKKSLDVQQHLQEQILPIVFATGMLWQHECIETVQLVCKSWRRIVQMNCGLSPSTTTAGASESNNHDTSGPASLFSITNVIPSWAQIQISSKGFSLPFQAVVIGQRDQDKKRHFEWVKNPKFQQLVTSLRFLRHVFDKLEEIRRADDDDHMSSNQLTWGLYAQRVIIWISYNVIINDCVIRLTFTSEQYDDEFYGDVPFYMPCWKCSISRDFRLLNYYFHTKSELTRQNFHEIDGRLMWEEE